jgi:hypothetical protein
MMPKLVFVFLTPAFALLACATSLREAPTPVAAARNAPADMPEGAAASDPKIVCAPEKPTGSNIVKDVCRSQALIDQERVEAERFVQRMMAPRASHR